MKSKFSWAALAALALLAGCIPSLNALYTEDCLIYEPSVVGVWMQDGSKAKWEFSQRDETSYHLVFTDDSGQQGRFIARLVKLEDAIFLDLFPEEIEQDMSGFYKFHLVPIHTIYRVRQTAPTLQLAAIDFKWLEERLAAHPDEIQFAAFANRKLVTAPTEQLQEFVLAHKDRFTGKIELVRPGAEGGA